MINDRNDKRYPLVTKHVYRVSDLVLYDRFARALEDGIARYPVFRELRFAARIEQGGLFDGIRLAPAWRAGGLGIDSPILDAEGMFATVYGSRKADYCSFRVYIWAADVAHAEETKERILAKAGSTRITEAMFSIDWHFSAGKGKLHNATIEKMADEVLCDAAYPEIKGGVNAFIRRYLEAPETVLVLQGPPGTGKTRLIRAIVGAISRRKGEEAECLYTGDMRTLTSDGIFVRFITATHDAFVVEDADHLLKPRADGTEHLHRFLGLADGVVRARHPRPPPQAAGGRQRAPPPLPRHRRRSGACAGAQDHFLDQPAERGRPGRSADPSESLLRPHSRAFTDERGGAGTGGGNRRGRCGEARPGVGRAGCLGRRKAFARAGLQRPALGHALGLDHPFARDARVVVATPQP